MIHAYSTLLSTLIIASFSSNLLAQQAEAEKLVPVFQLLLDDRSTPSISSGAFLESDGLIGIEMESLDLADGWASKSDDADAIGDYIEWTDRNRLQTPGFGVMSVIVAINTPGTYQFNWRNSIREGDSTTDANDSFLKILSDNFYGFRQRDQSTVCPRDQDDGNRCDGRDPEGSSSDGWFKVYRGGGSVGDWRWSASTSDSDAHSIFADFDRVGEYEIQISGRSRSHAIDRFVLYRSGNEDDNVESSFATDLSRPESSRAP